MEALKNSKELFTPSAVVLLFLSITTVYIYNQCYSSIPRGLSLPPGPRGKWITGNLHQIQNLWDQAMEWSKTYGPIVYVQVPRREMIILNSAKVALDLLDVRSKIYSDRPISYSVILAGRAHTIFSTSFTDPRFKILRKLLQDGLNPRVVKTYRPIQMQENQVLLKALANSPEEFRAHIRRNSVAMIIKATYGYEVGGNDDNVVRIIKEAFENISVVSPPGGSLVDHFPLLRFLPSWFPFAGFKQRIEAAKKKISRVENVPFEWAMKNIATGDFVESFVSTHLLKENEPVTDPVQLEHLKWASSALYTGGGDTTVTTLSSFFLAMALYPKVQKSAQEHIQQNVLDRLPTLDDYNSLPYVKALLQEVARWAPVVPLGLKHRVTQDDVYEHYFIPKGATVIANIRGIVYDAEIYPDPYSFDPTRFLGDKPQPDPFKFIFGFGRRACPGAHFAEMSLFLNIATILTIFDISKAVDRDGREIEPKMEWTHGITSHLAPFECQIKPRSKEHLALLEQADI